MMAVALFVRQGREGCGFCLGGGEAAERSEEGVC